MKFQLNSMSKNLTPGVKECNRRGQRKYYENNKELSTRNVYLCKLKKGINSKPNTLKKYNVKLTDFSKQELNNLNENVLAYLLMDEFKQNSTTQLS